MLLTETHKTNSMSVIDFIEAAEKVLIYKGNNPEDIHAMGLDAWEKPYLSIHYHGSEFRMSVDNQLLTLDKEDITYLMNKYKDKIEDEKNKRISEINRKYEQYISR